MYLLDTNVVAELAHNPQGTVAARLTELPDDMFGINTVIASEIEYALEKRGSAKLRRQVDAILSAVPLLELPANIAGHYGRIRVELERRGTSIGAYDLLIAAHGVASGITVVTRNDREFRRVKSLKVENWIR